jgi:hypothetical protein
VHLDDSLVGVSSCPTCKAPIDPDDAFCNSCGARLGGSVDLGIVVDAKLDAPGPEVPVQFRLTVVTGHHKDMVFPVRNEQVTIGRSPENDIALETDGYVSGKHTRVFAEGGEFFVEDRQSTNGTFIKVRSKLKLEQGDEIKVGQSIFRFDPE